VLPGGSMGLRLLPGRLVYSRGADYSGAAGCRDTG
jgi:hypothetical protein